MICHGQYSRIRIVQDLINRTQAGMLFLLHRD